MIGQAVEPAAAGGDDGEIRQLPFGQRHLGGGGLQRGVRLVDIFAPHAPRQLVELLARAVLLGQGAVALGTGLVEIRRAHQLLAHQPVNALEVALALPDGGLRLVEAGPGGSDVFRPLAIGQPGESGPCLGLPRPRLGQHRLLAPVIEPGQQGALLHLAALRHRQGADDLAGGGGEQHPIPLQGAEGGGGGLRLAGTEQARQGQRQQTMTQG